MAEELRAFLREQFAAMQVEISEQCEKLQELTLQKMQKICSGEKQRLWKEGQAMKQPTAEERTPLMCFENMAVPKFPEMVVPVSLPQSMPEELQVSDLEDAPLTCQDYGTQPLSIVPTTCTPSPPSTPPVNVACQGKRTSIISRFEEEQKVRHSVWKFAPRLGTRAYKDEEYQGMLEELKMAVFSDPLEMKEKLRGEMLQDRRSSTLRYKNEGLPQKVAKSEWFDILTLAVISLNAVWIAVDLDFNDATTLIDAHGVFIVMDNFFCIYFLVELLVRFFAYSKKSDCFQDPWFVFDGLLVCLMIIETWILTCVFWMLDVNTRFSNASILRLVRLVRLTKIARLARLLHALPELAIMVQGLRFAARTVFFCLCLVVSVIYVFALLFRELTDDEEIGQQYFSSVPVAMATLLFQGTMPDVEPFIHEVSRGRLVFGFILVLFVFLATLTLMNMLVGVLVAVMAEIADAEGQRRTIDFVKKQLKKVFSCEEIDINGDGEISEQEFQALLTHPVAIKALTSAGVDVVGLVDVSEFIFGREGDGKLSFADFMELVLNLRGSNGATVKDIVDLRMFLTAELRQMQEGVLEVLETCKGPAFQKAIGD